MPETPYCPLLSINKEVPVLCQEELCMWYVKQLKLCSITVLAYANALNLQNFPQGGSQVTPQTQKAQATTPPTGQQTIKSPLTSTPKKEGGKVTNPFVLDDLE